MLCFLFLFLFLSIFLPPPSYHWALALTAVTFTCLTLSPIATNPFTRTNQVDHHPVGLEFALLLFAGVAGPRCLPSHMPSLFPRMNKHTTTEVPALKHKRQLTQPISRLSHQLLSLIIHTVFVVIAAVELVVSFVGTGTTAQTVRDLRNHH